VLRESFRLLDVGEFLVVWWLVYRLLVIVRGTRTVPMAIGLLTIFIIYQATRFLELITLYTLLHTFLSSIVILMVIVFQEDIRRALVRVGRFARFNSAQEAQVVDEVIRGAQALAAKRIGALIVFEREALLDDFFIEAGTPMDAAVNGDLLYAIFIPAFQNPVHDGAVVLRSFRVYRAGAFLPLTRRVGLEKNLGTRHRAAIGITEETDAVALVVSEERGTLSLCAEGRIRVDLDPADARRELLAAFAKPKKAVRRKQEDQATVDVEVELVDVSGRSSMVSHRESIPSERPMAPPETAGPRTEP
jgi:uncharacterized protein (TIGR00159 family)